MGEFTWPKWWLDGRRGRRTQLRKLVDDLHGRALKAELASRRDTQARMELEARVATPTEERDQAQAELTAAWEAQGRKDIAWCESVDVERRMQVRVTDEQFRVLWERFPHDEEFIAEMCRQALYGISVPLKKGRWPKYDVRVYYDDGFHGSGYLLVHWDDASRVPNCLSNGYCTDPDLRDENVEWDDNPERERALSIRKTLSEWAYA